MKIQYFQLGILHSTHLIKISSSKFNKAGNDKKNSKSKEKTNKTSFTLLLTA